MIRYLKYELKKNFWTLVVLTAIAVIIYVVTVSTSKLFYRPIGPLSPDRPTTVINGLAEPINQSPQISLIYTILGIFCAVVPVLMYSFKMNKRSVDAFYSLPIKKEKMYLVKTLVGLLLVLIPYTIAYWLGFLTIALRENYFHLIYYIPGYFGGLLFGVCLYGIYAFAFTRANRVVDGVVFMLAYTFLGLVVAAVLLAASPKIFSEEIYRFLSFGELITFSSHIEALLRDGELTAGADGGWTVSEFLSPILLASIAYFLTFFLLRYEKGEEAEQNSDTWFGYRVLIPLYVCLLIGMVGGDFLWGNISMIAIGAIVMTIMHTRKVLFHWRYWAVIAASVALGILLNIVLH